jgi:hypothetical protein
MNAQSGGVCCISVPMSDYVQVSGNDLSDKNLVFSM